VRREHRPAMRQTDHRVQSFGYQWKCRWIAIQPSLSHRWRLPLPPPSTVWAACSCRFMLRHSAQRPNRADRFTAVRKRQNLVTYDLIILMSLTCDDKGVAGFERANCLANGFRTAGDLPRAGRTRKRFLPDGRRIFGARIII